MDLSRKPSTYISLVLQVGTLGCSCKAHVLIAPLLVVQLDGAGPFRKWGLVKKVSLNRYQDPGPLFPLSPMFFSVQHPSTHDDSASNNGGGEPWNETSEVTSQDKSFLS